MWVSKKKWIGLEKRVTDLERKVQDQSLDKIAAGLAVNLAQCFPSRVHIPEKPQQKL